MTRRQWLLFAAQTTFARETPFPVAETVRDFEQQGNHRTGTPVDRLSGDWLMDQVRRAGLHPAREPFTLNRVDPVTASIIIAGRRIEGIPLFDGAFTDARGVTGALGPIGSDAPIGIAEIAPNAAGAGPLSEARRQNRHRAIVVVTRGGRPGLCPSNADNFLHPFGPPVLQISSEETDSLKAGAEAHLIAEAKRTSAQSFNVTTEIRGSNPQLPPLIVMTPRSGWWTCASERGGGIVCWLELMRAVRQVKPARDVLFVASSGHEVGYLGIEAFIARRPGIAQKAHAWIHFGANVGAAEEPGNTVQASDDDMEKLESEEMTKAGLQIDRRVPRGQVPGGEAGVVHRGGGRYMSIIGRSALFHNRTDRGPGAIDVSAIDRFADAFTAIAKSLAASADIA